MIPSQVQAQADIADQKLKGLSNLEQDPSKTAQPKPEDQPNQPLPKEETIDSLKQKLSVLQGKYDAEVKALKDDVNLLNTLKHNNRMLTAQVRDLTSLTTDLKKQVEERPAAKDSDSSAKLPESFLSMISDEDREHLENEGFDQKTVDILGKLFTNKALSQSSVDLEEIKKEVAINRHRSFWSELNSRVSDWETINGNAENNIPGDPAFFDFLDTKIPYSDKTRLDVLREAQGAMDHEKVIQVFLDFKALKTPKAPPKAPDDPPKTILDPSKLIDPEGSVAGGDHMNEQQPQGKMYTRPEIKQIYDDYAKGVYRGREDEFKKLDADIVRANAEGRIQL